MNSKSVTLVLAPLLLAAGCGYDTAVGSIDLSAVSTAVLESPPPDINIEYSYFYVNVTNSQGELLATFKQKLPVSTLLFSAPAGQNRTITVMVIDQKSNPWSVYYWGATTANLLLNATNAIDLSIDQAILVTPRSAEMYLGTSQKFSGTPASTSIVKNHSANPDMFWYATRGSVPSPIGSSVTYVAPAGMPDTKSDVLTASADGINGYKIKGWAAIALKDKGSQSPIIDESRLKPVQGGPGTLVTINGSNFGTDDSGGAGVAFNGTGESSKKKAIVKSWGNNLLEVYVPPFAKSGTITVTNSDGLSDTTGITFTVLAPSITMLKPDKGAVGAEIEIAGSGFGDKQVEGSEVKIAGVAAGIVSWSATYIWVTVPPGVKKDMGTMLTVSTTAGTDGKLFGILYPPVIKDFNPNEARVGDKVTITGTVFGATQGNSAAGFTGSTGLITAPIISWSDTSIQMTVPEKVITGPIWVVTPDGRAESDLLFKIKTGSGSAR